MSFVSIFVVRRCANITDMGKSALLVTSFELA